MTAQLFVIAPKNHAFCTHKRANQFAAQQKYYKLPPKTHHQTKCNAQQKAQKNKTKLFANLVLLICFVKFDTLYQKLKFV